MNVKSFEALPETINETCEARSIVNQVENYILHGGMHAQYKLFELSKGNEALQRKALSMLPEAIILLGRIPCHN